MKRKVSMGSVMRCVVGGCFLLLAAGCDYRVALVKVPEAEVDGACVGRWRKSGGAGEVQELLILPLSSWEYLVSFPAGSPQAMFARGSVWTDRDLPLVQLDWFGTGEGRLPEDDRTYQYVSYVVEGDRLRLRLLNPSVVPRELASAAALAKAIADHRNDAALFREAMVFERVKD